MKCHVWTCFQTHKICASVFIFTSQIINFELDEAIENPKHGIMFTSKVLHIYWPMNMYKTETWQQHYFKQPWEKWER